MKMKTIAMATFMALGFASAANAADEGHGKITFYGTIIDAPCSIQAGDEDQSINLGSVSNAALQNGGQSPSVPFYINLLGCTFGDPATKNKVQVTFTGAAAELNSDLLGITGTASGVGVAMKTQGGAEAIKLGTATAPQTLVDGDQTLAFSAYVQGIGGATPVKEGTFQAVTDFQLHYN